MRKAKNAGAVGKSEITVDLTHAYHGPTLAEDFERAFRIVFGNIPGECVHQRELLASRALRAVCQAIIRDGKCPDFPMRVKLKPIAPTPEECWANLAHYFPLGFTGSRLN